MLSTLRMVCLVFAAEACVVHLHAFSSLQMLASIPAMSIRVYATKPSRYAAHSEVKATCTQRKEKENASLIHHSLHKYMT